MASRTEFLTVPVTVAATAHARQLSNNDTRIDIERAAGALLKLAG